uniref:Uncharacterized protein n=1 Tax=Canis lupus dingo TaxID=286419 RepID=A0A8C0LW26_CANLU
MGTRAFSHDSIFIPDGGAESEQTVQAMSQDNILGKVKTLQPSDTPSSRSPLNLPGTRSEMEEKVIGFELMYLVSLFQLPFPPPPPFIQSAVSFFQS